MNEQATRPPVSLHDAAAHRGRPHVALANADPDNINGRFVLARMAAFLGAMEVPGGETRGRLLRRILVIPSRTPEAAENPIRLLTRNAWHHVEMVAGEPGMDALPQVLLPHAPSDDERASACLFGLPSVTERHHPGTAGNGETPWSTEWSGAVGEHFLVRAGHRHDLQPPVCERLFRALVAFLIRVEAIGEIALADEEDDLHYFDAARVFRVKNRHEGLFVFRLAPGHWLQAGDLLGYVYDERDGSLLEEVRSPVAGLLAGLRRNPLVQSGEPLAVIHRLPDR